MRTIVKFILLISISILLHESGHIFMLLFCGITDFKIYFPYGIPTVHSNIMIYNTELILVSFGGILMNFILICIFQKKSIEFAIINLFCILIAFLGADGRYLLLN